MTATGEVRSFFGGGCVVCVRCMDRVGTEGREVGSGDREGVGKGVGEAVEGRKDWIR